MNRHQLVISVMVIQLILVLIGFSHHFSNPHDALFHNKFDGFKNYFTLQSYLQQDLSDEGGYWHYTRMNYPYGDHITFTDNTPALAIPLKWVHHHLIDLNLWGIPIFNYLILSSIVLSSLMIILILSQFIKNKYLIVAAALTLPWINPQLIRLSNGHFNLAISTFILVAIYLLSRYYERQKNNRPTRTIVWAIIGTLLLSSWFHIYYILIIGVFVAAVILGMMWSDEKIKVNYKKYFFGCLSPLVAILIFVVLNAIFDPELGMRDGSHIGFDSDGWKLKLSSLFTPYPHFGIDFIIHSSNHHEYESNSYLGSFLLFTVLLAGIFRNKLSLPISLDNKLVRSILIGGAICLIASLGYRIQIPSLDLTLENFINPIYWAKKISSQVGHFRCLGRFNWPFFWAANFAVLFMLDSMLQLKDNKPWLKYVILCLTVFLWVDAKDALIFNQKEVYENALLTSDLDEIHALTDQVSSDDFEAILPLPFYHIGTSQPDLTYAVSQAFLRRTFQLSTVLDLPLIASNMSRTPPYQATAHFNIFMAPDHSSLRDMKLDKPLMIFVNENRLCDKISDALTDKDDRSLEFYLAQLTFLETSHLVPISSSGAFTIYKWTPPDLNSQ